MRPALDPDRPNVTVLSAKVPDEDATYLAELARAAGLSKSELIRLVIQERLRRERQRPP